MTHVNPDYAAANNDYRVAGPFVEHNVGLVEIDWDTKPEAVVRLSSLGVGGQTGFEYAVTLGGLR